MGMIRIELAGSFIPGIYGEHEMYFPAGERGHAVAVASAIDYLAKLLPHATKHDHDLQAKGTYPAHGFGSDAEGKGAKRGCSR